MSTEVAFIPSIVCLSHLRWNFVFQRPQHLMTRCAKEAPVFFVEEPVFDDDAGESGRLHFNVVDGVTVVTPKLRPGLTEPQVAAAMRALLEEMWIDHDLDGATPPVLWYYTPMMQTYTRGLPASVIVYDCMDELSAFNFAPASLRDLEAELFQRADVVFTGGQSLFDAKKARHHNVHLFPSSIDAPHFNQARRAPEEPADQRDIPRPRIGFFGVIDERLDIALVDAAAALRPDWHFVLIGPVVKIDPANLPRRHNLHYLNGKQYAELPAYVGHWDVAMIPFARNASTQFISPTKTPEYLAAGRPVVSTGIRDVVRTYGEAGLAYIADTPEDFVAAIDKALVLSRDRDAYVTWLHRADSFLSHMSWDKTWAAMRDQILKAGARDARAEVRFEAPELIY